MAQSTTITVRLPGKLKERLEQLARATERSRSWLTMDAIRTYVEHQEWQVRCIEEGLRQADAGEFATEGEVQALEDKWRDHGR